MISYNLQYKFLSFSIYLLSLIMFLNTSSVLIFWILMEVNMISLIFSMYVYGSKEDSMTSNSAFRYLIVQTLGSLVFFVSATLETGANHMFSEYLMVFCLIGKMGIFPFHSWVYKMDSESNSLSMTLILTIQKIPIIMILVSMGLEGTMSFMLLSAFAGSIMLMFSKNLKDMIISSSIYFTLWAWTLAQISTLQFFLSYFIYTLITFMMLDTKMKKLIKEGESKMHATMVMTFLFLVGLPPASMFFFKLNGAVLIWESAGFSGMTMIWISVILATLGYLKTLIPTVTLTPLGTYVVSESYKGIFFSAALSQLMLLVWMGM